MKAIADLSFGLFSEIDTLMQRPLSQWFAEVQVQRYSGHSKILQDILTKRLLSGRSTSAEQPREKSVLVRAGGLFTDESHFFQLLQEIANVPNELRTREAILLLKSIRYFSY